MTKIPEQNLTPVRVIVDQDVGVNSPLWRAFQSWLGERPADYLFLAKAHKAIPDVEILDKLLNDQTLLLTDDGVLHNRACAQGVRSFTLNAQGQLQRRRLPEIRVPRKNVAPSVLKDLQSDYSPKQLDLTLKLTNGMAEKTLQRLRTRRRRIRSYFGSAANLAGVAVTIDDVFVKGRVICGYVIRIAGKAGVKGLRASEGYAWAHAQDYHPAFCVMHALQACFILQLHEVPTELFIISPDALALCRRLTEFVPVEAQDARLRALHEMLHNVPRLKLSPCVKGPFYDNMKAKLKQLSAFRSNELCSFDFAEMVRKINDEVPAANRQSAAPLADEKFPNSKNLAN